MKISVIIPVHNAQYTVENCVDKLVKQGCGENLQIVLVENGSSDNSFQKCKILERKYQQVNVYQSNKKGVSAARNFGLKMCDGDIVGFCDADDYYAENALKKVINLFRKDRQLKMVVGGVKVVKKDGLDWLRSKRMKTECLLNSKGFVIRILCDARVMGSVCNKFYKKEILKDIEFREDLEFCEDTYFNVEIIKKNCPFKIMTLRNRVYKYIKIGESSTKNVDALFNETSELKYIVTMDEIVRSFELDEEEKKAIKRSNYLLAVDNFSWPGVTRAQEDKSLSYIKDGIEVFEKTMFEYTFIRNLKFVIKGKMILSQNR